MNQFLTTNGPWSQLVKLDNIELKQLENDKAVKLYERLTVTAFQVPRRDEFTDRWLQDRIENEVGRLLAKYRQVVEVESFD